MRRKLIAKNDETEKIISVLSELPVGSYLTTDGFVLKISSEASDSPAECRTQLYNECLQVMAMLTDTKLLSSGGFLLELMPAFFPSETFKKQA